jgi:hypothetical protein
MRAHHDPVAIEHWTVVTITATCNVLYVNLRDLSRRPSFQEQVLRDKHFYGECVVAVELQTLRMTNLLFIILKTEKNLSSYLSPVHFIIVCLQLVQLYVQFVILHHTIFI